MAKRFTDTDKWKKPFIRALQGPYKLLWFYILDDCDHAGIWQVDFEVAQIRIGEKVNESEAIKIFGDRIEIFNDGSKWFLRDFIDFQYGQLSDKNRLHISVLNLLSKNNLAPSKPLSRGQGQGTIQGQGEGIGQGHGKEQGQPDFDQFGKWSESIIDGNDFIFTQRFQNEFPNWGGGPEKFVEIVNDHFDMLNRYPKMNPNTQERFRNSVIKHFREYKGKQNGTGTKKGVDVNAALEHIANHIKGG